MTVGEEQRHPRLRVEAARVGVRRTGLARRLGWVALATFALPGVAWPVVAAALRGAESEEAVLLGLLGLILGVAPLCGLASLVATALRPRTSGAFVVTDAALVLERRGRVAPAVPLADVAAGWTSALAVGRRVELELRSGDLVTGDVADDASAEAVLEAVGVAASRRALVMRVGDVMRMLAACVWGALIASFPALLLAAIVDDNLVALGARGSLAAAVAVEAAVVYALYRATRPGRVVVGSDGVAVDAGWSRRFARFVDVAYLEEQTELVALVCYGHERVAIPTAGLSPEQRSALVERIEAGIAAARREGAAAVVAPALERAGRPFGAWLAALRALAARGGHYREAAASREELERVLADPVAPVERRVGAAVALAATGDEGAVERVRVVAAASASEPVRVALERAADGALDEDAVARAVADGARYRADAR